MKRIAVLVLNDYAHDSRVIKEVKSLSKRYSVDVFAINSGGFEKKEKIDKNIIINRIIKYIKPNNIFCKKISQLLVYISFFFTTLRRMKKYDFIHCNDLETLPIGVFSKLLNKKVSVIYDAHEYETETLWMRNKYKKSIARFIETKLIKYTDKVICVSDAIAMEYVKLYNIEKPALVLNTPPYEEIVKKDIFRETLNISKEKTIFLYQGGLSNGRGIEILLETFKQITDDKSVIVFMGYGPLEELVLTASNEYNNIYFHEAVSPAVLLNYTSSADFGISTIEDRCLNYRYCLPNKMFEYLMAGIPVIASNLYEMKRLVESNNIGVLAQENTPKGLQEAIEKATRLDKIELQSNIQKVKEVYNWEEQEKVLLNLYKGCQ